MSRREFDEAGHAARVTALALHLADALHTGTAPVEAIHAGGPLHDIGKVVVAPAILRKPGPLDRDELEEIRLHPVVGAQMLANVPSVRHGLGCILHHHERWDGAGYPHRLAAHEIPFEARILAVADAFDAMTSDRPYRDALCEDEACAEVQRCAGTQFDPQVAEAFLELRASTRLPASYASAGSPRP
jgi:HD-GYP domain-containing protein (c-di-GMP phosphodiesterase class II)